MKRIPISPQLDDVFWAKAQPDDELGCLLWMGLLSGDGYRILCYEGKNFLAHRVAYCLHYGVELLPPETPVTDHLCCVRPCVEWSHLEAVTVAVNTARGRSADRMRDIGRVRLLRMSCREGHPLTGDNLILQKQDVGHSVSLQDMYEH